MQPSLDLSDHISAILNLSPDTNAIEFKGNWCTWGEISSVVDDIDAALTAAGLPAGTAVGILLRSRPQHVAAMTSILKSKRCIVTINPLQPKAKLVAELSALKLEAIIADAEDWADPSLREAAQEAGSLALALTGTGKGQVKILSALGKPAQGEHHPPLPGVAIEMLTSGTTGQPKRIQLNYSNIESSLLGSTHYESKGKGPENLILKKSAAIQWTTLVHISGMWTTIKLIVDGRPICLLEKFDIEEWRGAMRRHRPKVIGLPPTAIRMVLDADVPQEELSCLVAVRVGTAALPPALGKEFEDKYNIPLLVVYGATEFAGAVTGWTLKLHTEWMATKRGSVGRAHPGTNLKIVDSESGEEMPCGEVGLLEVQSSQIASSGKWVRTTDLAKLDEDGFLWITGRADDVIIRGGFKLSPADVVAALESHSAVHEASVVGIDDQRLGQIPVAAVKLIEGAPAIEPDQLKDWCREKLTGYQVPVKILIIEELPRTPSLKVSQPAVRKLFEEG
ncbi:MAG: acyl--CoA ligase [Kordiimonadaceae bacterium]|nr:acyl--CoA ligase [Kordiimonadaceae bacterium]